MDRSSGGFERCLPQPKGTGNPGRCQAWAVNLARTKPEDHGLSAWVKPARKYAIDAGFPRLAPEQGESLGSSEKEPILLDRALLKAGKSVTLACGKLNQTMPCEGIRTPCWLLVNEGETLAPANYPAAMTAARCIRPGQTTDDDRMRHG